MHSVDIGALQEHYRLCLSFDAHDKMTTAKFLSGVFENDKTPIATSQLRSELLGPLRKYSQTLETIMERSQTDNVRIFDTSGIERRFALK